MTVKYPYIFLALIVFSLNACKKLSDSGKNLVKAPVDVYVGGKVLAQNGNSVAVYWKNGVLTKVQDTSYNSTPESITVVGSDVYMAGYYSDAGVNKPIYWKNGSPVILPSSNTDITSNIAGSIAVNGSNIYVIGTATLSNYRHIAVIWTNGVMAQLAPSTLYDSYANTVMVNNGNVYVTGSTTALNGSLIAAYWLNGAIKKLADSSVVSVSLATGIAFNGNDTYISGYISSNNHTTATYWKNGQQNTLSNAYYSVALTVCADGSNNDVYFGGIIAGTSQNTEQTAYWNNGKQTTIGSQTTSAFCSYVSAYGNNLGISGEFGGHPSSYWLNGNFVTPTGPSASCSNIVVVPK